MGTANDFPQDLALEALQSIGFKVQRVDLASSKIMIGLQDENCLISSEDALILLHGVFFEETPFSVLNKTVPRFFLGEYRHQGILVLINKKEEKVYVIGDPGATRTVFYLVSPKMFVLTTDMRLLKLLQKALNIQLKPDILTLYEIMAFNSIVSRRTLYKGINRLLPGEYIVVKTNHGAFEYEISKYWNIMDENMTSNADKKPVASLIKQMINQLSKYYEELQGQKTIIPISGGLDSALLLLLAMKAEKYRQILALHVNLENRMELLLSKLITTKAKVPLHIEFFQEQWLKDNYIELLSDMLKLIGYPREGEASSPYLILARSMRSRFPSETLFTIGGEVGDSIFGGHDYYKFFAVQLLLEKRIAELLKLMKVLRRYNYYGWKFIPVRTIFLQLVLRFYKLRYQYFKSKVHKFSRIRNKKLIRLVAQYLTELSDVFYNAPSHKYYHKMVANMLIHKAPHIAYARVKAEESQRIITYLPFASRYIVEVAMRIPPEYFYFPIGPRSLQRLILKYLGAPPTLYLQTKGYFSIPSQILRNHTISSHMKKIVENCWISRYVEIDKLSTHQIHNIFNICIMNAAD